MRDLTKDMDVMAMASEFLHIILEHWDDERISTLLDEEFVLFEEEHQVIYEREEAIRYLKKQQENNRGQKIRDMRFLRKSMIREINILSCYGRLDWKADDARTFSIPIEMTLVFAKEEKQGKCLYMHSTNIYYRSQYEKSIYQVRNETLLNMITRAQERVSVIEIPDNREEWGPVLRLLTDAFVLVAEEYSNVYFVDIQNDSYVALKTEGKFRSLVGTAGNYTGINQDYADRYMDEINRVQYLAFTGRKNLLDNLEEGKRFLRMNFAITRDLDDPYREVEINIWLGELDGNAVSVFAFKNITNCPDKPAANEKDRLTGLLSYEKFREEGQKEIEKNHAGWTIVSTDIQNFRYVNEILGYKKGDSILKAFAERLSGLNVEGIYNTRVAADLFLTFVYCNDTHGNFVRDVKDMLDAFCREQKKKNEDIKIVLRTGIYFLDETCKEIDTAIDRANITRRSIGQSVNSEICVYGEAIIRKSSMKSEILATMDRALESGEFQVWVQPKVDLREKKLCGAEALARWVQEGKVCFYPDDFVPIFENNGFITSLDFYVLECVCKEMDRHRKAGHKEPVRISVNLSAVDVARGGIVNALIEIVDRYHIEHSALEFELTETAYFKDSSMAARVMERLKEEGFVTAVDDFGSGYSVMNMMINMPASVVKIDRIFMLDCIKTEKGRAFLEKLIGIIHELGYRVLCEGIETEEQYQLMKDMECDEGQGYYFGKPMPIEDFFEMLQ